MGRYLKSGGLWGVTNLELRVSSGTSGRQVNERRRYTAEVAEGEDKVGATDDGRKDVEQALSSSGTSVPKSDRRPDRPWPRPAGARHGV